MLAGLARSRMKAKHDALAEALAGMFTDHHAELAQLLLDQIAFLDTQITRLTILISEHLAGIRAAWGIDADGATGPGAGTGPDAIALPATRDHDHRQDKSRNDGVEAGPHRHQDRRDGRRRRHSAPDRYPVPACPRVHLPSMPRPACS